MNQRVLGVIPARGGSTRVPRKNLREAGGKPLVGHAIDQANRAESLSTAIVSTDDDEIADAAREHGGDVPFERPAELATDTATSVDVLVHALDWFEDRGESFDVVTMIQPTTPLRTPDDIDGAVASLVESDAESVVSLASFETPPLWAVERDDEGYLRSHFEPDVLWSDEIPRSQDLPTLWYPNGAVFAARVPAFRAQRTFYTDRTIGYRMPPERSVDVDEPYELELVRALFDRREHTDQNSESTR